MDNEEYHRLRKLNRIMSTAITRRQLLSNANAQRHIYEGFLRRLTMIQASWVHLRQLHHRERTGRLSSYEANDTGIHVNAYYLNVCGALDNLAWALQHEDAVLPGVTEQHARRVRVTLFGRDFLDGLSGKYPQLASQLAEHSKWHSNLRQFRDPAAHRIPLYVPPAVLDETTASAVERIYRESDAAAQSGDTDRALELMRKGYAIGEFDPVMILSSEQGLQMLPIAEQMTADHMSFLAVGEITLCTLLPESA